MKVAFFSAQVYDKESMMEVAKEHNIEHELLYVYYAKL